MVAEVPLKIAVRQPSAVLPIAMSVAALATVLVHISLYGTQPQADEGTAAHIWQLLMAGQLPIIGSLCDQVACANSSNSPSRDRGANRSRSRGRCSRILVRLVRP